MPRQSIDFTKSSCPVLELSACATVLTQTEPMEPRFDDSPRRWWKSTDTTGHHSNTATASQRTNSNVVRCNHNNSQRGKPLERKTEKSEFPLFQGEATLKFFAKLALQNSSNIHCTPPTPLSSVACSDDGHVVVDNVFRQLAEAALPSSTCRSAKRVA